MPLLAREVPPCSPGVVKDRLGAEKTRIDNAGSVHRGVQNAPASATVPASPAVCLSVCTTAATGSFQVYELCTETPLLCCFYTYLELVWVLAHHKLVLWQGALIYVHCVNVVTRVNP